MVRGEVVLSQLRDSLEATSDAETEHTIKEREIALDKELLQLVQGACKADNLQRALDVARLMHNPATVDAAAKVAAFYHLPGLQERIQGVKADKDFRKIRTANHQRKVKRETEMSGQVPMKQFTDFAPRAGGPRRSFGGVHQPRDTTPAASGRADTYIPETPYDGGDTTPAPMEREGSSEGKRKRFDEGTGEQVEDFEPVPKKRVEEVPTANGGDLLSLFSGYSADLPRIGSGAGKNPFVKKPPGSNPFAKPAVPRPLDAIKSTSFFDRVDNIESSGVPKGKWKRSLVPSYFLRFPS